MPPLLVAQVDRLAHIVLSHAHHHKNPMRDSSLQQTRCRARAEIARLLASLHYARVRLLPAQVRLSARAAVGGRVRLSAQCVALRGAACHAKSSQVKSSQVVALRGRTST
jgi:hypothetical protein